MVIATAEVGFASPLPVGNLTTRVDLEDPAINVHLEKVFDHLGIPPGYFKTLITNTKTNPSLWQLTSFNAGAYQYSFEKWRVSISWFKDEDAKQCGDVMEARYCWTTRDEEAIVGQAALHCFTENEDMVKGKKTTPNAKKLLVALRSKNGIVNRFGQQIEGTFPKVTRSLWCFPHQS
ncbi:hypothetical protein JCM16303_002062 [Sporobolomyces ruberrimus]